MRETSIGTSNTSSRLYLIVKLGAALGIAFAMSAFLQSILGTGGGEKYEVQKTDEEWKAQLSQESYYVLRKHGTEVLCSRKRDSES